MHFTIRYSKLGKTIRFEFHPKTEYEVIWYDLEKFDTRGQYTNKGFRCWPGSIITFMVLASL